MTFARIIFSCLLLLLVGTSAYAQADENTLKERLKARVAVVDAMKLAGVVGENNKGFLEPRGAVNPEQTKEMNAENSDRRAFYDIIAAKLHVTAADVGSQRAEQIRNKSAGGVWLQAADGSWYKR